MLPDLSFDPRHLAAAAACLGVAVNSDGNGRLTFHVAPKRQDPPPSIAVRRLLRATKGVTTITLGPHERVVVDVRDIAARHAHIAGAGFAYVEMQGEMLGQEPPLVFRARVMVDCLNRNPPGVEAIERPFSRAWDVIGPDAHEIDLPEDLAEAVLLLAHACAREWAGFFQGA